MKPLNTPSIEELQARALGAIDEITYCAEKLAECMSVPELYDEASAALASVCCRVDDLPMDIENIHDDAIKEE